MSNLDNFSEEELQAALERKKQPAADVITPVANPDFTDLIKTMEEVKAESIQRGWEDEDFQHYVYEMAMEAVYGKGYFAWRRTQKFGQ